jgi:hypothetical protein
MRVSRLLVVISVAATISVLGMACGKSSSGDRRDIATSEHNDGIFSWGVISTIAPRMLKVGNGVDYCVGNPRPRIGMPDTAYRGSDVYIRLKLHIPTNRPSRKNVCLGTELLVTRTVTVQRNLADIKVYDSGVQPPELRWPR